MKRYYICRRLGDGSDDNGYNSELRQYVQDNFQIKPLKQVIAHTSVIVLMAYDLTTAQHNDVVANVPQLLVMPEGALSDELSTVPAAKRNAIQTKLENAGFDFGWATLSNTIKDVLKYLAHSIQLSVWAGTIVSAQNFDITKTIGSISVAKRNKIAQHLTDIGVDSSWITGSTTIKEIVDKVITDRGYLYEDD